MIKAQVCRLSDLFFSCRYLKICKDCVHPRLRYSNIAVIIEVALSVAHNQCLDIKGWLFTPMTLFSSWL